MSNAVGVTMLALSAVVPVWLARQVLSLIVGRMHRGLGPHERQEPDRSQP